MPCPQCNTANSIERLISAPNIGDNIRQGRHHLPSTWTDKLAAMKSHHRHSTIHVPKPGKKEI